MNKLRKNQAGFSAVEIGLIVVIAAFVGFIGWFVHHAAQDSDKMLSSATGGTSQQARSGSHVSPATASSTSAAALQADLNSIIPSSTQSSQDLNSSSNSLNDQSTFTAVPQ